MLNETHPAYRAAFRAYQKAALDAPEGVASALTAAIPHLTAADVPHVHDDVIEKLEGRAKVELERCIKGLPRDRAELKHFARDWDEAEAELRFLVRWLRSQKAKP